MLHLINPRLGGIKTVLYCIIFFSGILLSELLFSSFSSSSFPLDYFFSVSFKYQAFCRSLCAAGEPTSQDLALLNDRLSSTLYPPHSSFVLHTQNEYPGQSLSPLSSSYPSIYPPITTGFQEHRPKTDDPVTLFLPLLPPFEPF